LHRALVIIGEKPIASVSLSEVEEGVPFRVHYPPFDIVLVKRGAHVFALEDACNHGGASLAEGTVKDACIACPLHGYVFSLESGALLRPKGLCGPQRTFRVEQDALNWLIFELARL
jgi:nitrite reductase/ring-hydroxylating ferredoxin subunit